MAAGSILVNRAPVLTLWAAIVAERLGYGRSTALALGKAVAGLDAQSKGRRLGIYGEPASESERPRAGKPSRARDTVTLLGREIPVVRTGGGLRPAAKARTESAAGVERYLETKFGDALPAVEAAMRALAGDFPPKRLAEEAFPLYERFRPRIPRGVKGWGAKGKLDLSLIEGLRPARPA